MSTIEDPNAVNASVDSPSLLDSWMGITIGQQPREDAANSVSKSDIAAMIGAAGFDPAAYNDPKPMPNLPDYSEESDPYGEFASRIRYANMSDMEQAAEDYRRLGESEEYYERVFQRRDTRVQEDISAMAGHLDDVDKVAQFLYPENPDFIKPHVAKVVGHENGKKHIAQMVMDKAGMLRNAEAVMQNANAISADSALLAAAWGRGLEDTYGGTMRATYNLGKDLVFGAGRVLHTGFGRNVEERSRYDAHILREQLNLGLYHDEKTRERVRKEIDVLEGRRKWGGDVADEGYRYWFRAPAATGSFVYDRVLSPVSGALGTTLAALAAGKISPALTPAMTWGASKDEAKRALSAEGIDDPVLEDSVAGINTMLEMVGLDMITRSWKAASPAKNAFVQSVIKPFLGEGGTEALQDVTKDVAAEIGKSRRPGYRFNAGAFFENMFWNGLETFAIGGLSGAAISVGGSKPLQTAYMESGWRAYGRMVESGRELFSRSPDVKTNPAAMKTVIENHIQKTTAKETGFMDAQEFERYFQNNPEGKRKAMVDMEISQQQLDTAVEAGAQVEISTAGLILNTSANPDNAALEKWVRPDPDAPTVAIILQEEEAAKKIADKLREIQEANESRPTGIMEFRNQIAAAWKNREGAQFIADLNYAFATVFGEMQGLTAEQYLELNPIKVFLSKQVAKAKSVGDVIQAGEDAQTSGEIERAAQRILKQSAQEQPGGTPEQNLEKGKAALQNVIGSHTDAPAAMFRPDVGEVSFIWGKEGDPARDYKKGGYGISHIIARRKLEALQRGMTEEQAEQYALGVVDMMPAVIAYGETIREYGPQGGERVELKYQGHTAQLSKYRDGNRETWLLTGWEDITPDDAEGVNPSRTYAQAPSGIQGQVGAGATVTIPATDSNVKQWDKFSIDTIVDQAGVSGEQVQPFRNFLQALIEQGDTLVDAQTLGSEFETATMLAETFEGAARGLERILEDPSGITQAVLDSLGIDVETFQEGATEIQNQVKKLNEKSAAYRDFYADRQTRSEVQRMAADMTPNEGDLADVTLGVSGLPNASIIRLFSGRQTRASIMHELYHVYNDRLIRAAKAPGASPQLIADFNTLNEAVGGGLDSADRDTRRDAAEKAAVLGERYLAEGQAPTPGLAEAFRRFRTWMTDVYRSISGIGSIEMTPEVRGVFDRMLGAETDIAQAREYYHDLDVLAPPSDATPEQAAEINQQAKKARATTEEKQFQKVRREFLGGREGMRRIKREVTAAINDLKEYRILDALKRMGGITYEQVAAELGDVAAGKMRDTHSGVVVESVKDAKDNTARLDKLAKEYDFGSYRELVEAAVNMDVGVTLMDKIANLGGLDEFYIARTYGAEAVAKLRENFGDRILRKEGGEFGAMNLANRYGYLSVADMLADLANAPNKKQAVRDAVQERIAEAESVVRAAMEQDGATVVDEAYHDDELSRALSIKQSILEEQARKQAERDGKAVSRHLSNMALRRIAGDTIAKMSEKSAGRYHQYIEAYRRHAAASARADAKGDKETASKEFQQMRLNHFLIKESIRAKKDGEAFGRQNTSYREWMRRLEGRTQKQRARVEEKYRHPIRDILNTWKIVRDPRIAPEGEVGATLNIPFPNVNENPELAAYAPPLAEYIAPWIINKEGADSINSWHDLTMQQIRDLGDALRILTRQGRGELQALQHGKIRTREELKSNILRTLDNHKDYKGGDDRGRVERVRRRIERYFVDNLQMSRIAAEIDGNPMMKGGEMGAMETVVDIIRGREVKQMEMLKKFRDDTAGDYKIVDGMVKRLKKEFKSSRFLVDGAPMPKVIADLKFRKEWDADMIRSVFFNMGNKSNLDTLMKGLELTEAHLEALSAMATEAEWLAIERIGKRLGDLYPVLDEVFFRQTNKHLAKVEPTPRTVVAKDGRTVELEGWYYPKKYDPQLSAKTAKDLELADFMETMNGVFNRNQLDRGFTNARQENVTRPMLLDTRVLVDHMITATRWATHAEPLLEFEALITDPDVQKAIIEKLGMAKYQYIREWSGRMAKPDKGMKSGMNQIWLGLRKMSTIASLGLNMRSALRQNESLGIAADIMSDASRTKTSGWYWLFQGLKHMGVGGYFGGFANRRNQAVIDMFELSAEARMRAGNPNKEIREVTQKADPTRSRLSSFTDAFFHLTTAMDQGVAGICWWGAYLQAESGNAGFDIEGLTDAQIREKSVAHANYVLRSQQSPYKADVTNFQADPGIQSLYTQFMGGVTPYLSHSAGVYQAWRAGDKDAVDLVRHLVNVYALPTFGSVIAPALLFRALFGDDDDDKESLAVKFAWAMASNMTGALPGVRDIVGAARYGSNPLIPPSFLTPGKAVYRGVRGIKKLSDGDVATASSDFGRALAVFFPIINPLRQAGIINDK